MVRQLTSPGLFTKFFQLSDTTSSLFPCRISTIEVVFMPTMDMSRLSSIVINYFFRFECLVLLDKLNLGTRVILTLVLRTYRRCR